MSELVEMVIMRNKSQSVHVEVILVLTLTKLEEMVVRFNKRQLNWKLSFSVWGKLMENFAWSETNIGALYMGS